MAIILLSFVGTQDPFSSKNGEDGSILTLTKHLHLENKIRMAILLYTEDLITEAETTQAELKGEYNIEETFLIAVNKKLSNDPINLNLAIEEAKKGLDLAYKYWTEGDILAFNASSGTPVMKSTWAIFQSAGYAPNSNVWQIRNPDKIKESQQRVLTTNVESLKQEFDKKIVSQQISNYNYSGALFSLQKSSLFSQIIKDLLIYGQQRFAFNFNQAYSQVAHYGEEEIKQLANDIISLRQNNVCALLKEVYFKASLKLEQKQYSDFLIWLFAFQENLLQYLMRRKFLDKSKWENSKWKSVESEIIGKMKVFDQGNLFKTLQNNYVNFNYLNRPMMMVIINYDQDFSNLLDKIKFIDKYASERNNHIHQLQGVEEIKESEKLLKSMLNILKFITIVPDKNPFDVLNQIIYEHIK
jgi:hypothetical protein